MWVEAFVMNLVAAALTWHGKVMVLVQIEWYEFSLTNVVVKVIIVTKVVVLWYWWLPCYYWSW